MHPFLITGGAACGVTISGHGMNSFSERLARLMKLIAPERYRNFQCITGACRHSCCIGWEIDIDAESLQRFQNVPGALGKRLRENIQQTQDGACFRLQGAEERCPFLNANGLCDLILSLGEDALCQICTDHPRFRNFFSDRTEIGLGLCCEAAGRLLLGDEAPMRLVVLEDDGADEPANSEEQELLHLRSELFALVQNRALPVEQRIEKLLPAASIDWADWSCFLLTLERLDDRWADLLKLLPNPPAQPLDSALEIPMEQLMCYLLYRHLPGALDDGDFGGRIRFAALIWQLIARLCRQSGVSGLEDLVELARLYSSEIEYSDENTCAILDHIAQAYEG